jgi:hypothetical protein
MLRSAAVSFSRLLPRAGSTMLLHTPAMTFMPAQGPAHRNVRLMSTTPEKKAPEQTKIVHDMVHFKTSTNTHPLGLEKLASNKEVRFPRSTSFSPILHGKSDSAVPATGLAKSDAELSMDGARVELCPEDTFGHKGFRRRAGIQRSQDRTLGLRYSVALSFWQHHSRQGPQSRYFLGDGGGRTRHGEDPTKPCSISANPPFSANLPCVQTYYVGRGSALEC